MWHATPPSNTIVVMCYVPHVGVHKEIGNQASLTHPILLCAGSQATFPIEDARCQLR